MNMLEVFNKVEAHLLSQGAKSMSYAIDSTVKTSACAYRGEMGRSCAIGCLIKDQFYHRGLEGLVMWIDMLPYEPELAKALTSSGIELNSVMTYMLYDLQRLHDAENIEYWEEGLQKLREIYFGIHTSNTCDEKTATLNLEIDNECKLQTFES